MYAQHFMLGTAWELYTDAYSVDMPVGQSILYTVRECLVQPARDSCGRQWVKGIPLCCHWLH